MDAVRKGLRPPFGQDMTEITKDLNQRTGVIIPYTTKQVSRRISALKSIYSEFTQLLNSPKGTGLGWDANTNTVVCDDHQWENFKGVRTFCCHINILFTPYLIPTY
jgi:hypothetical protein